MIVTNMNVTNAMRRSAQIVFRKLVTAINVKIVIQCAVQCAWGMRGNIFCAMDHAEDAWKVLVAIVDYGDFD